jgi:MSHA biogenesis protein MshL
MPFCANLAKRFRRSSWIFMVFVFLTSCQTASRFGSFDRDVLDEVQASLSTSGSTVIKEAGPVVAPEEVLQDLVPDLVFDPAMVSEVEERFDFSVKKGMEVREFFALLTVGTDHSVVVHPDVTGQISALDLKNVTVEEVLDQIRGLYDYDIVVDNGIYQIRPGGMQTQIFRLNYLNVSRSGNSTMQVTSSGISDGQSNSGGQSGGFQGGRGNNSGGNNSGQMGQGGGQNSGSASISTTTETDYWKDLEEVILGIIDTNVKPTGRNPDKRTVIVSPHTGMILVKAYPKELRQVEKFLNASQEALQRQVILEAKILEVELQEGFQAGINLQSLYESDNKVISTEFGSANAQNDSLGSPFTVDMQFSDFSGVIKLLETQGNVQVISSPRILTLNNQKAIFKVGQEAYYLTNANTTSFGAGIEQTTNQNSELEPFFSGIALDVTPQISDSGDIILHIHPILSEVKEDLKVINGQEFPLANSATRESDTVARVRNGEVIVISGLMQTRASGSNTSIPGVNEVPVLGSMLAQKRRETVKTELVILLRALVDQDTVMAEMLDETAERFDQMRRKIDPYYRGDME